MCSHARRHTHTHTHAHTHKSALLCARSHARARAHTHTHTQVLAEGEAPHPSTKDDCERIQVSASIQVGPDEADRGGQDGQCKSGESGGDGVGEVHVGAITLQGLEEGKGRAAREVASPAGIIATGSISPVKDRRSPDQVFRNLSGMLSFERPS